MSLCLFQNSFYFSVKNRFIKLPFLYIFNSNFRPKSALRRTSDLVHEKALELSFHLVPMAPWRTTENPRYKASKFAKIATFVWGFYGANLFASNSRKKIVTIPNTFPYKMVLTMWLCSTTHCAMHLLYFHPKIPFISNDLYLQGNLNCDLLHP